MFYLLFHGRSQFRTFFFFERVKRRSYFKKGFIEFICLRISAISPFYQIERLEYRANGAKLNLKKIDNFKNDALEKKLQELIVDLELESLFQINYEELDINLPGEPFENYESDRITYFSFLFE